MLSSPETVPVNQHTTPEPTDRQDGFTLIELLIVIVILGVLATVVVFAVGGITNRGNDSSVAADASTIVTAQEAYRAQNGTYTDEAGLVAAGFLRAQSKIHDITLTSGGADFTLVAATPSGGSGGSGGGPTPTTAPPEPLNVAQTTTYAGLPALRYGSGSKTLVFLESQTASARSQYNAWVASNPPIPNTQFIFITSGLTSIASVESAIAQNATAYVAAYQYGNRWAPGIGTNIWWIRGGGYGAFGTLRNPGLPNVIQWEGGVDVAGVVSTFTQNY